MPLKRGTVTYWHHSRNACPPPHAQYVCNNRQVMFPRAGPVRCRRQCVFALAVTVVTFTASVWAAPRPPALPPDLTPAERARLAPVADAAALATRFEAEPFPTQPAVFEYLLDHPEFATHVTRALKVARYRIWRTPEGMFLDDGWGTRGHFELVHAGKGVRVMYARGAYEQRLLPNIAGEAVVIFEYAFASGPDGQSRVVVPAISGFVKLESRFLSFASRVASTFAKEKADKEAQRLARVFMRVSRAIEENPARVYDLVRQRADVPARDLEEFRQLLNLPRTATP